MGPLIHLSGANGPRVLGISSTARVSEAISGDSWLLPRGRHRITQLIRASLPVTPPALLPDVPDVFLWRNSPASKPGQFVASKTWETLYPATVSVPWHKTIWFKTRIPKHAFLSWVAILNRLPTKDRLQQWGLNISPTCLLCDVSDESRDHIFFACPYSQEVWTTFFTAPVFSPPSGFEAIIAWLPSAAGNPQLKDICCFLVQAILYVMWRERNLRLHTSTSKPSFTLVREVKVLMKAKLLGLDRLKSFSRVRILQQSSTRPATYLYLWFHHFDR